MNKIVFSILIIGAVVAGVFLYAKYSQEKDTVVLDDGVVKEEELPNKDEKKMAFSQFMSHGGSYECDVNQYIGNDEYKGKVYISDGKLRGSYSMNYQGTKLDISFIVRDGYSYTWTSMGTNGFKSPARVDKEYSANNNASGAYAWNANQIGDYDCTSWKADESRFAIPENIVFADIQAKAVLN